MAAQDVSSLQETSWSAHFTLHHLQWGGKVEHVVLARLGIVEHQSRTFLTTRTSDALQEVAWLGRNACIGYYVQVTDVNTHLQGRGGGQYIDGMLQWLAVFVGMVFELMLNPFSYLSVQKSCMFVCIDTGRRFSVIYLAIVVI